MNTDRLTRTVDDLHHRHAGAVYRKCLAMLSDRAEAEDAVQETYLKAYLILTSGVADGRVGRPWLYAIARHVCLHMLRTRRRKGVLPIGEAELSSDDAQHRRLLARSHLEWLLDERDKRILATTFLAGLTQAEAARRLGVSRRAVVKRIASMRGRYHPGAERPQRAA